MPGSTDRSQDLDYGCEAHPGDHEHALGLRSHGYWAVASLAPYTVPIPRSQALAPNMVLLMSGTFIHGQQGHILSRLIPPPHQGKPAHPSATGPEQPGPRSICLSALINVVHSGLKILRTEIASLPAGENQGQGNMGFLVYITALPLTTPSGGSQAAHPTSDPQCPHSHAHWLISSLNGLPTHSFLHSSIPWSLTDLTHRFAPSFTHFLLYSSSHSLTQFLFTPYQEPGTILDAEQNTEKYLSS